MKKRVASLILAASMAVVSIPVTAMSDSIQTSMTVSAEESYTIPDLNLENKEIPDTESFHFVNSMGAGFNLGNTFDAIDNSGAVEGDANMYLETSWLSDGEAGTTTHETIDAIKDAGFTTVRIPVSWHNHLDADFNINPDWLAKVTDIVDYALSQKMYVILNIHHDCEKASGFTSPDYDPSWAAGNKDCYIYPDNEHLESSINYVTKIWEQLGENFEKYDEHLVFETMNEPRQVGNIHEWWYADDDCCHEALECITKINQAAVDTVRKTGGNNSDRYIMVPATSAKAEAAMQSKYFQMPKDSAEDRLILSVHAYEPFDFSMNKTSEGAPTEFTDEGKKALDEMFDTLYVAFVQQNIPVVIGEFGATNRNNTQARTDHAAYYYAAARARGISCCLWDNSNAEGDNEAYRFLDRTNKTFIYDSIAEAAEKYGAPRTSFQGGKVDGVVSNKNCTIYPDGKVMFPCLVGEKVEIYFDIDTTKSLCGGGALCFNLNVDGKGYWIGFPFRAGVEWNSEKNKDVPVPYTVDLTDLSTDNMNAVCWSENRQVSDTAEREKLSKLCQESANAEIQIWWSLDLNWGDRPDSSVTAGKSEDEVSDLKAAAAKEVIKVISVRPMSMELDPNMGEGFGTNNGGNGGNGGEDNPPIQGEEGTISGDTIQFQSGIGKEMVLEVEKKSDCVGGGGCISFMVEMDGNEYWVAYEWQTNDSGVVKLDMTTPDQVTLNDEKIEDAELLQKIGEECMTRKEANLVYWWAAQSWGNNYPDGTAADHINVKSVHITYPVSNGDTTETTVTTTETTEITTTTTTTTSSETESATTESTVSTMTETTASSTTETTATETTTSISIDPSLILFGDVNLDGRVDITDSVLLNKASAGQVQLNEQASKNADCNGDNELDNDDALTLLRFLVHIITTLPSAE